MSSSQLRFEGTDLFCGGGGVTEGIHRARYEGKKIAHVRSCVNHDPLAIESHRANHRGVHHFIEDVTTQDEKELFKPTNSLLNRTFLHASLECTNFSKAKGGMSRENDSRTLADHLLKYIIHLDPDYITIENVREFLEWGPLEIKIVEKKIDGYFTQYCPLNKVIEGKGKRKVVSFAPVWHPIKSKKGSDFNKWVASICKLGYYVEWKILNCADYGAYTSRERLIMIFAKKFLPIVWPEKTFNKQGKSGLKKWKPVKDVLNFDDEGKSIFSRKKPLSENTLKRIYAGMIKYIAGGNESFLQKYFSGNPNSKVISINGPAHTITNIDHHSLVKAVFIHKYNSNNAKTGTNPGCDVNKPSPVISTQGRLSLVQSHFLTGYYTLGGSTDADINNPCPTLTTKDRFGKVTTSHWIDKQYGGNDQNHQSIDRPAGTIMQNDKHVLMTTENWIDKQYSNGGQHNSVEEPAGAITTVPKLRLIHAEKLIVSQNFTNTPTSVNEPAGTITANRKWHYLVDMQFNNIGTPTDRPSPTLLARMDKKPPYLVGVEFSDLVITEEGELGIVVYEDDSEYTIKIKEFMAIYGIIDIKMRMLRIPELKLITGFPVDYILKGTQERQKKFIGNAVPPILMKVLYEAIYKANIVYVDKKLIARSKEQVEFSFN